MTSPVAFSERPAPAGLTPAFPPHLPRTGVRRPAARPAHRPSHPPRPAKTNPLGHPLQLLQGGPRRPGGAGPGGGGGLRWPTCRGTNPVSRGSWGEVGPWGEVPVSVVRHREEKVGDPARGGEKARPGGGFGVSPPLLAPWTSPDRGRGGKMGVSAPPAPPPSPPGTWGLITSQKGFPKHGRAFPPRAGGSRRLRPDCLADPGQEGQAEGRLSESPQYQGAFKETLEAFPALTSGCPSLAPSGGGGEVLAP